MEFHFDSRFLLHFFFKQFSDDVSDRAVLFHGFEADFFVDVLTQVDSQSAIPSRGEIWGS